MCSLMVALNSVCVFVTSLANNSFFVAFFSACAGAFAGAYTSQVISEKTRRSNELQKEIRVTNASIAVAASICNSYLSLKKEHVHPRIMKYKCQRSKFDSHSGSKSDFILHADFQTIPSLSSNINQLRDMALENLSLNIKSLLLVDVLTQSINSQEYINAKRNELIECYREKPSTENSTLIYKYFGLLDDRGNHDTNYPDTMEGIENLTDDCIFFSNLMIAHLTKHGESLVDRYKNTISKKDVPTIEKFNFDSVAEGLIPGPKDYPDWKL